MADWHNQSFDEEEWQVPSDMEGIGPRTFEVTEDTILQEVCRMLEEQHMLDQSDISVHVDEGEVTLSGSVPTREAVHVAEEAAASIEGVFGVNNRLHVQG